MADSEGFAPPGGSDDPYPAFPPLPVEHGQPPAPSAQSTDPDGAGSEGAGPGHPATQFALAETHPQPAVLSGLGFDPDQDPAAAEQPYAGAEAYPPPNAPRGSALRRIRLGFRTWRRSRPFWGGLFVVLGGGEILFSEKAPLRVIVHFGLTGLAGYLIPSVMVLCGVLLVFNPAQRTFYSILSVLLALATWPTSNLGGFLVGMLFGLIGGSLAFAWMPLSQIPETKAPKRKRPKAAAHG